VIVEINEVFMSVVIENAIRIIQALPDDGD
jgi:hypothetical protein